jgi:hypothetical protein
MPAQQLLLAPHSPDTHIHPLLVLRLMTSFGRTKMRTKASICCILRASSAVLATQHNSVRQLRCASCFSQFHGNKFGGLCCWGAAGMTVAASSSSPTMAGKMAAIGMASRGGESSGQSPMLVAAD